MRKLFTLLLLLISYTSFSQIYYNFTANTPAITGAAYANITAPVTPGVGNSLGTVSAPIGATSVSSGYTGASGGNNLGNAVKLGAINTTSSSYMQFQITNGAAAAFAITNINFGSRSTATGPQAYGIYSSNDNYTAAAATGTLGNNSTYVLYNNTVALTIAGNSTITIRIYGGNGAGSPANNTVTWRIDDVTFIGAVATSAPTVTTTTPATAITTTGATLAGNVSSDGGSTITARGIVWSQTTANANPAIGGTGVTNVVVTGTTGAFNTATTITTLPVNTQISFKAYATNSVGTSYGAVSTFWTLANVPNVPSVNTPTTTTLNVIIDPNANPAATQFAIQESGGMYVQANGTLGTTVVWQTAATWGTVVVNGLTPATLYTFAVKARNGDSPPVETAFSSTASGTTTAATAPIITAATGSLTPFGNVCTSTTTAAETFQLTGSNLDGTDVTIGPLNGFQFSTDGTTYATTATITYTGGGFPATTVYVTFTPTAVQSYAGQITVAGGGISPVVNIPVTGSGINTAPAVVTGVASTITINSASLADTITDNGCTAITAYGIEYSTTSGFANGTGTIISGGTLTTGAYATILSGLSSNTAYYYHAFAVNSANITYGLQKTFTTAHLSAPVATTATDTTYYGFMAHWTNVPGATGYRLYVYSTQGILVPNVNIASWTFPSSGAIATADPAPATSANNTSQIISFSNSSSSNVAPSTVTGNPGSAATFSGVWQTGNGNAYIQVNVNTTNFSTVTISSDQYSSATGPKDFKLQYKIGSGGTWTDVPNGATTAGSAAWISSGTKTLPVTCNGQPDVAIRWLMNSTTSASGGVLGSAGTSRIDNIIIKGQMGSSTNIPVAGYNPYNTTDTFAVVTGLQPDSTYHYYVKATNTGDSSAASNTIDVRTLPLPQIHFNTTPASSCSNSAVLMNIAFTPVGLLTGTFSLQLSDATGHFPANTTDNIVATCSASPVTVSWSAAAYPAGTYKIRIINDAPEVFYGDTSAQFKISDPINVTAVPQPQSVCNGNAALLELDAANVAAYQWRMNSTPVTAATQSTYNAPATGSYDVVATALPGCADTTLAAVAVTVATTPATTLAATGASETFTLTDGAAHIFTDATCQPIIHIIDTTGGNTLGATSATLTVDNAVQQFNGQSYLQRHADIHATSSGPATVIMYFLQSEFDAYNAMPDVTANQKMPSNPTDMANMGHLGFTLYHAAGTGGPDSVYNISSMQYVGPGDVQLTWNGNYWEASFTTSGFSGFFAAGGVFPLAIVLKDISATNMGTFNRVNWTTATEQDGDVMQLERSKDGISFKAINSQPATSRNGAAYSYDDAQPFAGINYYRLRIISQNGDQSISKTVSAVAASGATQLAVYPNPATSHVTLSLQGTQATTADVRIADFAGRTIQQATIALNSNGTAQLNINTLSSGTYIITCTVSGNTFQSVLEKK